MENQTYFLHNFKSIDRCLKSAQGNDGQTAQNYPQSSKPCATLGGKSRANRQTDARRSKSAVVHPLTRHPQSSKPFATLGGKSGANRQTNARRSKRPIVIHSGVLKSIQT